MPHLDWRRNRNSSADHTSYIQEQWLPTLANHTRRRTAWDVFFLTWWVYCWNKMWFCFGSHISQQEVSQLHRSEKLPSLDTSLYWQRRHSFSDACIFLWQYWKMSCLHPAWTWQCQEELNFIQICWRMSGRHWDQSVHRLCSKNSYPCNWHFHSALSKVFGSVFHWCQHGWNDHCRPQEHCCNQRNRELGEWCPHLSV